MNANRKILFFLTLSLSTFVLAQLLSYWINPPYVQYVNGVVSTFGLTGLLLLLFQFPGAHFHVNPNRETDADTVKLVIVRTVWNPMIADVHRLKLRSHEIRCVVQDRQLIELNWLYAHAIRGTKVVVTREVAEEANRILSEPSRPTSMTLSDRDEVCPNCRSTSVYYHRYNRRLTFLVQSLMLGSFAVPIPRRRWVCMNCGWTSQGTSLNKGS